MQTWAHWDHGISIRVSLQKKCGDGQLTLCYLLVYKSGGYLEAVNTCAKLSMMEAITEVKALPNYAASGEVRMCTFLPCYKLMINHVVSLNSGLLLMLDTTRHPMPSIPLSPACLEGNYAFNCCCE